jgi:hypothetical protein
MKYIMIMGTMNVKRLCKKFKGGMDSVKDAPHASRPKTATSPKLRGKVKGFYCY